MPQDTRGFMGPRIHWTIKQLRSIISDQAAPCYAAARAVAGNVVAMLPSSSHLGTLHWLHTTLSLQFWTIDFSWKIIENCKEAISHLRREQFISGGGGSQSPQLGNYYKQIQQEELFSISPISLSNLVSIYLKWSTRLAGTIFPGSMECFLEILSALSSRSFTSSPIRSLLLFSLSLRWKE